MLVSMGSLTNTFTSSQICGQRKKMFQIANMLKYQLTRVTDLLLDSQVVSVLGFTKLEVSG